MKPKKYATTLATAIVLCALTLGFSACDTTSENTDEEITAVETKEELAEEVNQISVGWKIELVYIDYEFDIVRFALYLRIIDDTNRESLFYVSEYEGTFWEGDHIANDFMPQNTLLRGMNWFAGSGNNFYAILVDGNIVVYEQQVEGGYFGFSGFFKEVGRLYLGANIDIQVMEVLIVRD